MSTVLRRRVSLERSSAQTSRNSLREGLERCGMPEECVEAVVLSADEAYVNGLVHSEQPQGSVTVSNDVEIGRLLPELRDMGRGLEIGSEDQRRTQPDPLSSHGRGLLTQRFMDEVEITDDRAGGTRVRLTKDFLPASPAAVASEMRLPRSQASRRDRLMAGKRGVALAALAVFLGATIALPASPAKATPTGQEKAAAQVLLERTRLQLKALNVSLEATIQQYDLAELKLEDARSRAAEAGYQLTIAQSQLNAARDVAAARIVAIYKQPQPSVCDVIFSSESLGQMSAELWALREIGASDSRLITQLEGATAKVREQQDVLAAARTEARSLLTEVAIQRTGIEVAIARQRRIFVTAKAAVQRIQEEEAAASAAAARAAATAAQSSSWGNPRNIPEGPAGAGHPEVIAIARKYLGIPYVYGAADPKVGFDCSGLVMYCYAQIGIQLPHYSGYQQNLGVPVPMDELIPGDLVFKGYPTSYHVGLYAGGGSVIEAPHTGDVVRYDTIAGWMYAVRLR